MSRFLKRFASVIMIACLLLNLMQVALAVDETDGDDSSAPTVGTRISIEGDDNSPALTYSILSLGEGETKGTVALVQPISDNGQYPSTSPYTGSVTIPETIEYQEAEYTVVKILSYAFMNSSVTSVTIPATVQEIGESAFLNCSSLSSVTFADESTLDEIGQAAFSNCSALTVLSIPDSVTTIGTSAFNVCGVTSLTIPAGVKDGLGTALAGYDYTKVQFASGSPYEIDGAGLYNGTVLEAVLDSSITSFSIRAGTTEIGEKAFSARTSGTNLNFTSLTSVSIPNSVTSIGDSAFEDCSALTSVTLPDGLTTIGESAFERCSSLTALELPKELTSIGASAFYATALETVVIPDGVTTIPEKAFSSVSTLKTVVIPASVNSIGEKAFDGVKDDASGTTFIMQGTTAPEFNQYAFGSKGNGKKKTPVTPTALTVVVPSGAEENYSAEGSILKTYITTTDGGDETTKPGISYKLEMTTDSVSVVNGDTVNLGTAVVPTDWKLNVDPSNNDVVTINELAADTGAVTATANSVGTVTVKFSITNDSGIVLAEQTCKITVTAKPVPVTGITLSETSLSLREGKTETLTATVEPENATDKTITWTSSDESVAKVDANGVVTAVSAGTATIKATIGTVFDECAVTVTKKPSNSGNSSTPTYTVSTPSKVENGTVTVSPKSASKGTTVTITVKPDSGYELDDLTVTDKNGDTVKLTRKSDTQYTFTMPASKVDIEVTFAEIDTTCDGGKDCPSYHFVDVNVNDWYHEAVDYMVERGLMNGTSATTFAPNTTTTRAMLVSVLYRMENYPAVVGAASFNDVPAGQYYTDAVAWASANGIVTGYGNGNFGPNDTLTREQMAAIIYRYAAYKGYDVSARANLSGYTDAAQISGYAADAMAWINAEDIIGGTSATTLSPAGNATRCQFAVILMRFCENVAK